jgi:glycosyltransferase involved in cell wall biosynthesis
MKKISIVIPMYNVANYLEKSISSVFNQGMDVTEFELILVNDGSTDSSLEVAQEFVKNKSNVKIISQVNKGLGGARNTGINNSEGLYILFLDADDWFLPNCISKLFEIAIQNKLEILEFGAQGVLLNGQIKFEHSFESGNVLNGFEYYNNCVTLHSACNKMYSKDFIYSNNLRFTEHIYIEDFEFNTRALSKAKRVMGFGDIVAQFLQSPNSITRNQSLSVAKKRIDDLTIVLEKTKNCYLLENNPLNADTFVFFNQRLTFLNISIFFQVIKNSLEFKDMKQIRSDLQFKELLYINFRLKNRSKEIFRLLLRHCFFLFLFIIPILKINSFKLKK